MEFCLNIRFKLSGKVGERKCERQSPEVRLRLATREGGLKYTDGRAAHTSRAQRSCFFLDVPLE